MENKNVQEMIEKIVNVIKCNCESAVILSSLKRLSEEYIKIMPTLSDHDLREEIAECSIASKIIKDLWWNDVIPFDMYTETRDIIFSIKCKAEEIISERKFNRQFKEENKYDKTSNMITKLIRESSLNRDDIINIVSNALDVDRGIVEWSIL